MLYRSASALSTLPVYRAFHPQGDVDRLYFKRSQGGRGLISVEDCVNVEVNSLRKYVESSDEKLLILVSKEAMLEEGKEKQVHHNQSSRRDKYRGKVYMENFTLVPKRGEIVRPAWDWLKRGNLKRETEGMLMAAQDQALRTKYIRKVIDKENISATCRLCGERDETIAHIVSECKMLAQKQYKNWRHDRIAQVIHWELCKKYNMEHAEKWYEHKPEGVIENENVKMLWDMKIQTDREIEHSRPDILTLNQKDRSCLLIDVTCPFDTRVIQKERKLLLEHLEQYITILTGG